MSARRSLLYTVGGLGAAAVAALATGVVVERRVVRGRRAGRPADRLGTLRSEPVAVTCGDGVVLHVEVDEVRPFVVGKPRRHLGATLIFVHGYALNLDCWRFRVAFAGSTGWSSSTGAGTGARAGPSESREHRPAGRRPGRGHRHDGPQG